MIRSDPIWQTSVPPEPLVEHAASYWLCDTVCLVDCDHHSDCTWAMRLGKRMACAVLRCAALCLVTLQTNSLGDFNIIFNNRALVIERDDGEGDP